MGFVFVPEIVSQVDRRHPALTDLTLDAVAAFYGCVQAGDWVRAIHMLKMRLRPVNREEIPLWMDGEDCQQAPPRSQPPPAHVISDHAHPRSEQRLPLLRRNELDRGSR